MARMNDVNVGCSRDGRARLSCRSVVVAPPWDGWQVYLKKGGEQMALEQTQIMFATMYRV